MRYLAASVLVVGYILFCWVCWRKHRHQQLAITTNNHPAIDIVIAYASQTGAAAAIARQTAQQLHAAGMQGHLVELNQLATELLLQTKTLLMVTSTYGEGEAPDNGNRFAARLAMLGPHSLAHLQVAILGLGDSGYQHFCGFAHQLQHQLHHCGAQFLTDVIEVDRLDESALRHWQYYLGQLSGNTYYADWSKPDYTQWKIVQRECINPGSLGAPVYHLKLIPLDESINTHNWCAGDIAEIGPGNSPQHIQQFLQWLGRDTITPSLLRHRNLLAAEQSLQGIKNLDDDALLNALAELPHREYSIASVPSENSLDLLVRQVAISPGHYGLGSGWLTLHAPLHQPIALRIRTNAHFHSPDNGLPLILIGNGTGIAGLRSHLANPARAGTRNWLLFGERSALSDSFFNADILRWQQTGLLTRVDRIFSRDAPPGAPHYVQDLLLPNAQELQSWVAQGAAIFVCGSLHGMAQAVDTALCAILGAEQLESMADERRYCRDVY